MKEKFMSVLWLSLRRAYRVLKDASGDNDASRVKATLLREAMNEIFGKGNLTLDSFVSQVCQRLNDIVVRTELMDETVEESKRKGSRWNQEWQPFTEIVETVISECHGFETPQPEIIDSGKNSKLSKFIGFQLRDSSAMKLRTSLSSSFLVANVPEMQASISNMMDAEHDAETLLGFQRVIAQRMDSSIPAKVKRELVRIMLQTYISENSNAKKSGMGLGYLWDSDETRSIWLRGFKSPAPESWGDVLKMTCTMIRVHTADANLIFNRTPDGILTRQLLAPVLKRFRSYRLIVATSEFFSAIRIPNPPRRPSNAIDIYLDSETDNRRLLSGRSLLELENDEKKAEELRKWFDFVNIHVAGGVRESDFAQPTDANEEGVENIVAELNPKLTLTQFFHKVIGPVYLLPIPEKALASAEIGNDSAESKTILSDEKIQELTKIIIQEFPLEIPECVKIYGEGAGVVVTDITTHTYRRKICEFLNLQSESFYQNCLGKLQKSGQSLADVCKCLASVPEMPFTLARLSANLNPNQPVHVFLGH